jgi:hypothetical protein
MPGVACATFLANLAVRALGGQTDSSLAARFPVGETQRYEAKLFFVPVGTASMQVVGIDTVRGESTLHVRFVIESRTSIYRMHDQMDSWVGLTDFRSRRYVFDQDEGGKKHHNAYDIFPDSGYYRHNGTDTLLKTSAQPLDDAAFFYFTRTLDLVQPHYAFNRYFRPEKNPVVLEVIGRDTIDVPAGKFATIVVHPIIQGGGVFKEAANARMWLSDDSRRIMVQMQSTFGFGTLTLRLFKTGMETPAK